MKETTRHLLHLAGLSVLFYGFAFAARGLGIMVVCILFFPLGLIFECRFWWHLFRPSKKHDAPSVDSSDSR